DSAVMRGERDADETGRLRKIHVVELLLQFRGEQFGELVLEALALLVGERKIARVGAHPQHLGIDEFDREIEAAVALRPRNLAAGKGRDDRQKRNQPAAIW